jgi:tight adherence protein B
MPEFFIWLFIFSAIVFIINSLLPLVFDKMQAAQSRETDKTEKQLDSLFIQINKQKLILLYTLAPLILGVAGLLFFGNLIAALIGVGIGLALPTLFIKQLEAQRMARLHNQIVDALMIISSSLKGGLSLIQAIEILVEEMPTPISQEFGLILRENKMGVTFDESLRRLYRRIKTEEFELVINSILVARETGGDLTRVFSRLSTTIRDNRKLKDNVRTLTMQGRLQGIIMSILPFIFMSMIVSINPHHFDTMLESDTGRMLLVLAVLLQITGMVLIRIFSTIRI